MADFSARGLFSAAMARLQSAAPEIRAAAGKLVGPLSAIEKQRPLTQQYLYVGVQKPDDVASIMRLADTGYMYRICDYWEEQLNRDCHLGSIVFRREHAPSRLKWQIIPASEKRRDVKIAAWVELTLQRLGEVEHRESRELGLTPHSLADLFVHLNGANIYGYAGSEIAWSKVDGRVVPAGALPMPPRRFIYAQHDGSLRWSDVTGGPPESAYPGKDLLRDYAAGRFVVHRPRVNGAVGTREGMIRPLLWASTFRTWTIGDWMKLAELAWKPYRWGTYDSTAGDDDKIALENALQLLMAQGWASLPSRTELHIEYAKGNAQGLGQHGALCAFLGAEMSKRVLGATLTVEEGNKGTARTAGVHQDVERDILIVDARAEEATIQRQLVAPLVRANFGSVGLPRFVFVTEDVGDMKAIAEAVDKFRGAGNLTGIPMRWVRQVLGCPEPDEGEEVLGGGVWAGPTKPVEMELDEPANDVVEPEVSDKMLKASLRNYHVHNLLCDAGIRVRQAA